MTPTAGQTQGNPFAPAVKTQARGRVAIYGPSKSGKSLTGLRIARGMVGPEGRIAAVDTEGGSLSKYADITPFDRIQLRDDFHPKHYVRAILQAEAAGYDAILIDSLSHAWSGKGGIMSLVDTKKAILGDGFRAWAEVTPEQDRLVEAILNTTLHLVATMRTKTAYAVEQDGGKTRVRKVGTEPIQRDGIDYEFDILLSMDLNHRAIVIGQRGEVFSQPMFEKPGEELGVAYAEWLHKGAAMPAERTDIPTEILNDLIQAAAKATDARRAEFYAAWLPERGYKGTTKEELWHDWVRRGKPDALAAVEWLKVVAPV